jgi:hypothetical protein
VAFIWFLSRASLVSLVSSIDKGMSFLDKQLRKGIADVRAAVLSSSKLPKSIPDA